MTLEAKFELNLNRITKEIGDGGNDGGNPTHAARRTQ